MATIESLQEERSQYLEQLDIIQSQLQEDPANGELAILKQELTQMITLLEESLTELKSNQLARPPGPPAPALKKTAGTAAAAAGAAAAAETGASPSEAKSPRDDHPASKPAAAAAPPDEEPAVLVSYSVNDTVMAKWISGDKAFYAARITAITGSSAAPIYTIKFKNYGETDNVRAKDIRPMSNKRKADGAPAGSGPAAVGSLQSPTPMTMTALPPAGSESARPLPGAVIAAAANLYPDSQPGREAEDDPTKPHGGSKKMKPKRELEAGKNKWQDFNKSKVGKSNKKDSMFRTPEGIHGRVGFTGSGQAMRKDPKRSRHVYQQGEELD